MSIDENYFFREATLRICGSLEIEKALWDCFMYIRNYIPADIMHIDLYDPVTGLGEVIAKADLSGGELTSIKNVAPEGVRKLIEEMRINPQMRQKVFVADRISDHPIMGYMSEIIGHPDAAFMAIGPKPEWDFLSGILVGKNGGEKYSEEHVRLFSLLHEPFAIALSNYLRYRELLRLKEILADDNRYLQEELRQQTGEEIVGAHFGLKQVMEMVNQVAPMSSPVLLSGETGTGKEVIATAIHNLSPLKNGPFIKVNCGAIPESLMDSELFGHEKGAFTGAFFQKRGRFERALILNRKRPLAFDNIGYTIPRANTIIPATEAASALSFDQANSQTIIKALKMAGGRVGGEKGAAKLLKLNPSTLRGKMRKLGIPFGRKRHI
ncbi:MAG: sigma 54-interacting transcriptional regulator [Desulfobacterales bacterium]